MLDQNGRVIEDGPEPKPVLPGEKRVFRVWLDCNQYRMDMENMNKGNEVCLFVRIVITVHILLFTDGKLLQDVYETFNILMRRKPKENNFKAVLETIRELMNTECVVPEWLHDIILGYGDPGAAHYSR